MGNASNRVLMFLTGFHPGSQFAVLFSSHHALQVHWHLWPILQNFE